VWVYQHPHGNEIGPVIMTALSNCEIVQNVWYDTSTGKIKWFSEHVTGTFILSFYVHSVHKSFSQMLVRSAVTS
jgi:hypothetical protein